MPQRLVCAVIVALHAAGVSIAATGGTLTPWLALTHWVMPALVMFFGALLLPAGRAFPLKKWRSGAVKLALLAVGISCLFALWTARGAHPGLEHWLEALILLVRGDVFRPLWFLPLLLGLYLLTPPLRALLRRLPRRALRWAVTAWAALTLVLALLHRLAWPGLGLGWLILWDALGYVGDYLLGGSRDGET